MQKTSRYSRKIQSSVNKKSNCLVSFFSLVFKTKRLQLLQHGVANYQLQWYYSKNNKQNEEFHVKKTLTISTDNSETRTKERRAAKISAIILLVVFAGIFSVLFAIKPIRVCVVTSWEKWMENNPITDRLSDSKQWIILPPGNSGRPSRYWTL